MSADVISTAASPWQHARAEWQANARLRLGVFAAVGILWLWGLLVLQDQAAAWTTEADAARQEVDRLRPMQTATHWTQRAQDARQVLEAADSMVWTAGSQGVMEADLQDLLKQWSEKAGLTVRELAVGVSSASPVPGVSVLHLRLAVDFNRVGLTALLSELHRSPKLMIVDVLRIKTQPAPGRAELEVKLLFRKEEPKQ